jgi:hypothetical protein
MMMVSSSAWATTDANVVPTTTTAFPVSPLRLRRRPPTPSTANKVTPPSTPTQEPMSVVTDIDSCPLLPLLPSSPPIMHQPRHVRFASTAQVMLVRKRSDAEKRQAWYCAADYQMFDQDRRRTLRHYGERQQQRQDADEETSCMVEEDSNTSDEEEEDMTLAGLEGHLCREVALHRKRATRYHCYNVLRQQYYNRYWYNMPYGDQAMESLRQTSLYYSSSNIKSATPTPPPAYYNDSGYYYHYPHHPQQQHQPPHQQQRRYQQHHHQQEGYMQAMMQRSILKML